MWLLLTLLILHVFADDMCSMNQTGVCGYRYYTASPSQRVEEALITCWDVDDCSCGFGIRDPRCNEFYGAPRMATDQEIQEAWDAFIHGGGTLGTFLDLL